MTEDFRQEAEAHWGFVEKLIANTVDTSTLEKMKYLYVEAMVHGFKHALNSKKETSNQP